MIPSQMISTTFDLPGYHVDACLGEVMGLTVRSRNVFSVMGSGLKSLFGGSSEVRRRRSSTPAGR